MKRKNFQEMERSKFKYPKMMKKDVSGGGFQNFRKNEEKRRFKRWRFKVKKIRKNDEKLRFRRSKVKVQKIQKNDEKRRFRKSKVKVHKIQKNDEKRRFTRSKFKKSEKMMRKDVSGG